MADEMLGFTFEGVKYRIDSSQKVVPMVGDFDERTGTIFIHKDCPKKFHEGIALHEVVERRFIKKGHSYQYAHNEAQKAELDFYKRRFGDKEGEMLLREEEEYVLSVPGRKMPKRRKREPVTPPAAIEIITIYAVVYEGKQYIMDNTRTLTGDLVDFYEKKGIIYIDNNVPEKFFEGMALLIIEERKLLKQGWGYGAARGVALKKELAYYEEKFGSREAAENNVKEELALQAQKFAQDMKHLKKGERKVVNEDVPK